MPAPGKINATTEPCNPGLQPGSSSSSAENAALKAGATLHMQETPRPVRGVFSILLQLQLPSWPSPEANRSDMTLVPASQAWFRHGSSKPASSDLSSEKCV